MTIGQYLNKFLYSFFRICLDFKNMHSKREWSAKTIPFAG